MTSENAAGTGREGITFWHNVQVTLGQARPPQNPASLLSPNGQGAQTQVAGVAFVRMETPYPPGAPERGPEGQHIVNTLNRIVHTHLNLDPETLAWKVIQELARDYPNRRSLAVSNLFYLTYDPMDLVRDDLIQAASFDQEN